MKKIEKLIKQLLYILNLPQKILCVIVFVVTCIGSLLECIGVSVIIPVVNVLLEPEKIMSSTIVQGSKRLSSMNREDMVIAIIFFVILVYLAKNIFFVFLSWIRIKFSCKIQRETGIRMMRSYMNRGYQFFLKKNYGELYRGVAEDTISIYSVLYTGFRLVSDVLTIILLCAFMVITDWSLSMAMIFVSIICVLLIYFVFRKRMQQAGVEYRKYSAQAGQAILQAFQGIKDVLILRKQAFFINEYEKNLIRLQKMRCRQIVGQESPTYIIEGLCVTGIMAVIAFKALMASGHSTGFIANLAAFALAAFRILPSLGRISISINQVITCMPSIDAVYENIREAEDYSLHHPELVFDTRIEHKLIARECNEILVESADREDFEFKKTLSLKNVSFRYSEELEFVIKDLNLTINKGQSIALIGESGAGKSTLVDILLGLLPPQEGEILIDDIPIVQKPDVWAKVVGYVPQSVFLADDSIQANIAFGIDKSCIDEERVWEAIERAKLGNFVRTLPDGINTFVGDRGVRLSGGQRQRIAIARALYHRPQIMVLDEATSALDNDTETAIMSAIDALQGEVTLIIVAHRLSTVKNCNVIYEVGSQGIKVRDKTEIFS